MSDSEALMWNVEKDPWMNPSGGVLTILDRPIDAELFRARIMKSVADIPRLRERVVSTTGRFTNPTWESDSEFDFDWHFRHLSLPSPGTERQLLDLTALLLADPYDRTRPLWQFVIIDGLADGRGALFWRFHHSIMDGRGALRLTESYMDIERDVPKAAPVDLESLLRSASPVDGDGSSGPDQEASKSTAESLVGHAADLLRGPLQLARKTAAEAMMFGADPSRAVKAGTDAGRTAKALRDQLGTPGTAGSTLWQTRSRRRHVETFSLSLEATKAASKALGCSINDLFVAGAVLGAAAYHRDRGVELGYLNVSFVVSTRTDNAIGGNSFTPTLAKIAVGVPANEQVAVVSELMAERRAEVGTGSGMLSNAATLAKLLPTSVVTGFARQQAAAIDFATSNMRGAPFDVYIAGAKLLRNVTLGPVAGSAFNLTCLSMGDHLDIGMHIDPVAVAEPADLRSQMETAFDELLTYGAAKKSTSKGGPKSTSKGAAPKATRKASTKAALKSTGSSRKERPAVQR